MLGVTFGIILTFSSAAVADEFLVVTHNAPAILGATVTVRADVYDDQTNKSVTFPCIYGFLFYDDAEPPNQFMDLSKSCSSEWIVTYKLGVDQIGEYTITVVAYIKRGTRFWPISKVNTTIGITPFLNGQLALYQNGAALRYSDPAFLHSKISAHVELSAPDAKLLSRLGAFFNTDWSFVIEIACIGECQANEKLRGNPFGESTRVRTWSKNAQPGFSFEQTFTSFHGSYVEARARLRAVVPNDTDSESLGNTYGFFYRRFILLDPLLVTTLTNFTAESGQKLGHIVVNDDEVDALIIKP